MCQSCNFLFELCNAYPLIISQLCSTTISEKICLVESYPIRQIGIVASGT